MNDTPADTPRRGGRHIAAWLTPVLVLLTPFFSFLKFQEYPILTAEIGLLGVIIAALGIAVGAIIRWGGRLGTALGIAAVVVIFADLQFEIRIPHLLLGGAVLIVAGWFIARAAMPIVAVVFAVVFLSTLILPAQIRQEESDFASANEVNRALSPVIHIILDEHTGIEGFENRTPLETATRTALKELYLKHGFRVFGGAYSNYAETFNSIPNMLNNTLSTTDFEYVADGADGLSAVKQNAYLKRLSDRGYGIRIYQSKYFNFCEGEGIRLLSCDSYNYTGLDDLDALTDKTSVRAELVISRFLNRSRLYGLGRSFYQELAARGFLNFRRIENNNFAPLASYPFFERLEHGIAGGTAGQVLFAHLLIPHRPFMFNADCNVVLDHPYDDMERKSDPWLREYRKAYFEQIACTNMRMGGLFAAMKRAGIFDKATIIVHSDHGGRIEPDSTQPDWELAWTRSQHSTLMAVKSPGIRPGYDNRLFSVGSLLNAITLRNGGEDPFDPQPDARHIVIEQTKKGAPMKKQPLADFRIDPDPK